ncbi:TPM domain-containing protein [Maridesulfovibrio sp.]|uniref:TPM domain-containing protein n=1 Tax=Maridesulfovibrio sp. TaxID=2795000 RepID=UPI002A1874C4|nr:TPM domain-containing protein [Maridesulfovibrio sp.]
MALMLKPYGRTASEKFLRMIGILIIFGLVAWAFWMNNQSTLEKLQARNALWDQTKILSRSEREFVQGFIRSMRSEFGVKVRIQIITDHLKEPKLDSNELYIGISPAHEEVIMSFPGLVRHALGDAFIEEMEKGHFTGNFTDDKWPTSLMTSLSMIWERLLKVDSAQPVIPVYSGKTGGNTTDPESGGHTE